jgi:hypothetical protein
MSTAEVLEREIEKLRAPAIPAGFTGFMDMTAEQYHAATGLSASGMQELRRSPAHYQAWLTQARKQSKEMKLGEWIHVAVLEPERWAETFVCAPEIEDRRTKEGKAKWQDFCAAHFGKTVLDAEDYAIVQGAAVSVMKHPLASELLKGGRAEQSMFWTDPDTGTPQKARLDYIQGNDMLIDLKSCEDASFDAFQRSIVNYGRHHQSFHYLDGYHKVTGVFTNLFVHVAVEKKPPFAVAVYLLDDATLERAMQDVKALRLLYKDCLEKNEWPAYPATIQPMNLPHWAF